LLLLVSFGCDDVRTVDGLRPASEDAGPFDGTPPDAVLPRPIVLGVSCPSPGEARAHVIADAAQGVAARASGGESLADTGDILLVNAHAAFAIQGVERLKTWWYYGGGVIDAQALVNCAASAPERFGELAFLLGRADLTAFETSTLRGFAAERVEVIRDGSDGGEARVRVYGRDDRFWLIELELMKRVALSGDRKLLSEPLGAEVSVDYVLEPDARVLRMEVTLRNVENTPLEFQTGLIHIFGDETRLIAGGTNRLSFGGVNLTLDVPWIGADADANSVAVGLEGGRAATTSISGVDTLIDLDEFVRAVPLMPGESRTRTFLLSVGPGRLASATAPLTQASPVRAEGQRWASTPLAGRVTDAAGRPMNDASVRVERADIAGGWFVSDVLGVDFDGRFTGPLAAPETGARWRLSVAAPGRAPLLEVPLALPATEALALTLGPRGAVDFAPTDPGGPMPARLTLYTEDGREVTRAFADAATERVAVAPGRYRAVATRGYEYSRVEQVIDVPEDGAVGFAPRLERAWDAPGYLSTDGHVHAALSPDSQVSNALRLKTAAANGLEVMIATDHEAISDWGDDLSASGLAPWLAVVPGIEVTATVPEHINIYPVATDPAEAVGRGGFPKWYGLALGDLFEVLRARGAGVIDLNHPRNGCGYLCMIDYDRLTGLPRVNDPLSLGLPAGAALWSWGFDTMELLNGHTDPFMDSSRPRETGLFEDWMSFLNLGHRVTATAVTDTHGLEAPGDPRTYFAAGAESPSALDPADLVASMRGGRAVTSAGAFAQITVEGRSLGDDVSVANGRTALGVRITALPEIDVTRFQVFFNCDAVADVATTQPSAVTKFDDVVSVDTPVDGHVVVVGWGEAPTPLGLEPSDPSRVPRFVTNAVFIDADGDGLFIPPGGKACATGR